MQFYDSETPLFDYLLPFYFEETINVLLALRLKTVPPPRFGHPLLLLDQIDVFLGLEI